MIRYFWKSLKPSIKVEINQQDRASISFEEMVQKAVNTEAKTGLKSNIMVWNLDACCSRSHRLFHNTFSKVQTQGSKDPSCPKETKIKNLKSALSRNNAAKSHKKDNRKDKKKRFQGQRRKYTREQKKQTPATNINTTNISKKNKKEHNVSEITYFNCDKKGHFAIDCTKSKN